MTLQRCFAQRPKVKRGTPTDIWITSRLSVILQLGYRSVVHLTT